MAFALGKLEHSFDRPWGQSPVRESVSTMAQIRTGKLSLTLPPGAPGRLIDFVYRTAFRRDLTVRPSHPTADNACDAEVL